MLPQDFGSQINALKNTILEKYEEKKSLNA